MKKVMVFGSFDIIHKGHIYFLEKAKSFGDFLTVIVARDKTILAVKGNMPHFPEEIRKKHIDDLHIADTVLIGNIEDKYKIIEEVKPDIICLGHDQEAFTESLEAFLDKNKISAKIIRLDAYKRHRYRSSLIRSKMSEYSDAYKSNHRK
jgi:FAD synthetase